LDELLALADFVTLHVPKTDLTHHMIGQPQIQLMKKGSYLLNASRGTVVQLDAAEVALRSGHLAGAAFDVYPTEPEANINDWTNILQNCPNTILTPHIGGSTEEAQETIGTELAEKMIKMINSGSTGSAVNFPSVELPYGGPNTHRILNVHKNIPGVLKVNAGFFLDRC
jgi:D-3-phosphoglycerate dehydrogenase